MPLSHTPITARRASDNAVSSRYGAKWCSTHTPSPTRPGPIGEALANAFVSEGYLLATTMVEGPSLVEVYPHPALVELAKAEKRLPYKLGNTRKYWPTLQHLERCRLLLETWSQIIDLLDREIAGVCSLMQLPGNADRGAALKAFEDMLDAVVCVWAGVKVLEGRATPHGDTVSSIWIPRN